MKRSALFYACGSGCVELVTLLLTHGGVDVNAVSSNGMTAVMNAAKHGHISIIEVLLKAGACVVGQTTVSAELFLETCIIGRKSESNDCYGVFCAPKLC